MSNRTAFLVVLNFVDPDYDIGIPYSNINHRTYAGAAREMARLAEDLAKKGRRVIRRRIYGELKTATAISIEEVGC